MKYLILFIFLINFSTTYGDTLYIKDGRIINGELNLLNKYNIGIKVNNNIYIFDYYYIDYFVADVTNEKKINIKINDINKKVIIVKLSQGLLFYKENQDNSYSIISINSLSNISYYSREKNKNLKVIYYSLIKRENNINSDLDNLIERIYENKKNSYYFKDMSYEEIIAISRSNVVNINDDDYYEKIWDKTNKLLGEKTAKIFWTLIENYSNKENYLIQLMHELKSANESKNNIDIIKKMNAEILIIRNEFYSRLKKIIINRELQIN
jgi:hypothetical protein